MVFDHTFGVTMFQDKVLACRSRWGKDEIATLQLL
jgi:hypothetical protein